MKYTRLITFSLLFTALATARGGECDSFQESLDVQKAQIFQMQKLWNAERRTLNSFYNETMVAQGKNIEDNGYDKFNPDFWDAKGHFDNTNASLNVVIRNFNQQVIAFDRICSSN